jgi:RNA polymerase sigma factor (sigma-70 family)
VPGVVQAMLSGAVDCLEKPVSDQRLIEQIFAALAKDQTNRSAWNERERILERIKSLSPREREVMLRVTSGLFTRQIAEALNLSTKTVEAHRARMMQKMQADGIAALVRMVEQAGEVSRLDNSTDQSA